ncbi:MAG: CPBP family intramembrane glutamic endopeptidase [Spirochaetota bacterium]
MFDLRIFSAVFLISVPGIVITVPRIIDRIIERSGGVLPNGKPIPPRPTLIALGVIQSCVFLAGLSAVGAVFAPRVGPGAPVIAALVHGGDVAAALPNPLAVVGISLVGIVPFLLLYYVVFRPWLDDETAATTDALRRQLGLGARLLYGGVVEEVLMRWGVMSLLAWLFGLVLGAQAATWTAIIVAGILFGIGHIPSYAAAGCKPGVPLFTTQIVLNLLAALVFGYLFARFGLFAAIVSHMLFHLVWYPIDVATARTGDKAARSRLT